MKTIVESIKKYGSAVATLLALLVQPFALYETFRSGSLLLFGLSLTVTCALGFFVYRDAKRFLAK